MVAQLAEAMVLGTIKCGFESLSSDNVDARVLRTVAQQGRASSKNGEVTGSIPVCQ